MRVVEPRPDGLSLCMDSEGGRSEVMTELVGAVGPGDVLLVHAGVAIARLT
jgi:hydrogenase maturation factor